MSELTGGVERAEGNTTAHCESQRATFSALQQQLPITKPQTRPSQYQANMFPAIIRGKSSKIAIIRGWIYNRRVFNTPSIP